MERIRYGARDEEILDVESAATLLGVSTSTIYALARQGKIPVARVGKEWRFVRQQLIDWVAHGGEIDETTAALLQEAIAQVQQSYGRALRNPALFQRFYDLLMQSHPDMPAKFQQTDFPAQYERLQQAVPMALLFPQGNVIAQQVVERLRTSHNRHNLDIHPSLYAYWIDSLVQAIAESDPAFTEEVEQDWREVLQISIDYIKDGY
jgi:excisionase family DNA binding protein